MKTTAHRYLSVILLSCLFVPGLVSAGSITLTKTSSVSRSLTGTDFTYTINYTCPGITGDCNGVVIRDILPPAVEYRDILADANTATASYAAGTRTATWTMNPILTAGSAGQVKLIVRFPPRITPDETEAVNQATAVGTNVAATESNLVSVIGDAVSNFTLQKTKTSGNAVLDQDVVYRIRISSPNVNGILNLNGAVLTDSLPAGAVFVSASGNGVHSGAASGGTVSWDMGNFVAGAGDTYRYLVVRFPSSSFTTGTTVVNNGTLTGTPVGATEPFTAPATLSHTISATASAMNSANKFSSRATAPLNAAVQYRHEFTNNGSYPYDTVTVGDLIPAQLQVTSIRAGQQSAASPPFNGSIPLTIEYQTNLNAGYRAVAGSPFATNVITNVAVSALGLQSGEAITALRYTYTGVPVAFNMTGANNTSGYAATLLAVDRNGTPVTVGQSVPNTATFTAIRTGSTVTLTKTATLTVIADATLPVPIVSKSVFSGATSNPGELVRYQVNLNNAAAAGSGLVNPVLSDLLNSGMEYAGNWFVQTRPTGMPDPTFEQLSNYDGTGRTLLRWRWEGARAYTLPVDKTLAVRFDVRVKPGTAPGLVGNSGQLLSPPLTTMSSSSCQVLATDIYDLNGDGNRSEQLCTSSTVNMTVLEAPSLAAVKLVKGQLDSDFHAYPQSGLTVAGGDLAFRFTVTNTGNVTMTNGSITDILPFVGDTGVVDTSARLSEWRPELTAPVPTPTGVVAYYSSSGNPCRPDLNPSQPSANDWPTGCEPPLWSVQPPADITDVQSIRFDFGTVTLAPQQSFTFTFSLQAPISAPTDGEIAWNSYGYEGEVVGTATKLLPSEPVKVGIAVDAPAPANYGNYVWRDTNQNGIQDEDPDRGLNGVRVELYQYRGAGDPDPSQDTLIGFRLTGDDADGHPGFYQFTNQPAGAYYAAFTRPAGYSITLLNKGTDPALDSDAAPATGFTTVTTLSSGEIDYTWDMGVFPATTAEVGDYVWFDRNGDGIQNEATLDGLNGVIVNLYLADNSFQASTRTADDENGSPGYYRFSGLTADAGYYLEFIKPTGSSFPLQVQGGNPALDSNVDPVTGRTGVFTLTAGAYDPTLDAGIKLPTGDYLLGDRIWQDQNNNGLYEPFLGDVGLSGVRVNLYRDDGDGEFEVDQDTYWSATTTFVSDGPGFYAFAGLPAGGWIIQIPAFEFAPSGQLHQLAAGTAVVEDPSDNVDNDNNGFPADPVDGVVTGALTLGSPSTYPADFNPTLDIGLHPAPPIMTLVPPSATNQVCLTDHTVLATVRDHDGHEFIEGQAVTFTVTAGPNLGRTGVDITDDDGEASFTWTGSGGIGIDEVVASLPFGTTALVTARAGKLWEYPAGGQRALPRCRVDGDADVDLTDINLVTAARNQSATSLCDQRDADFNGIINTTDAKLCIRQCTRTSCATQ